MGHRRRWSQNGDEKSMGLTSERRASPGRSVEPPQLPLRLSPGAPTCSPAGTGTIPQQPPISRQRAPKRRHALGRNQQQRQQHHGSGSSSCAARKQQQLWPGRAGFLSLRFFCQYIHAKTVNTCEIFIMKLVLGEYHAPTAAAQPQLEQWGSGISNGTSAASPSATTSWQHSSNGLATTSNRQFVSLSPPATAAEW